MGDRQDMASFAQLRLKVILSGDYGVGKSTLFRGISRMDEQKQTMLDSNKPTPETYVLNLRVENEPISLKVWDTVFIEIKNRNKMKNGQEKYSSVTISFYQEAQGVFLCFDLTNNQSFENLQIWIKQIKQHADDNVVIILLGLKSDLDQGIIKQADIDQLVQVSAITNLNVLPVFQEMAQTIMKDFRAESHTRENKNSKLLLGKRLDNQARQDDYSQCNC